LAGMRSSACTMNPVLAGDSALGNAIHTASQPERTV
jgi:hypothetical protein